MHILYFEYREMLNQSGILRFENKLNTVIAYTVKFSLQRFFLLNSLFFAAKPLIRMHHTPRTALGMLDSASKLFSAGVEDTKKKEIFIFLLDVR